MSKPLGRTPAKQRQDAAKINNLTGTAVPGGTLTDFRAPEVVVPLRSGGHKTASRKVNSIGKPVPKKGA